MPRVESIINPVASTLISEPSRDASDFPEIIKEEKKRLKIDLTIATSADIERFIKVKKELYELDNHIDADLWKMFTIQFCNFIADNFGKASQYILSSLQMFLRQRGVWVLYDKRTRLPESLAATVQEKSPTMWTDKEIANYIRTKGHFNSQAIAYRLTGGPIVPVRTPFSSIPLTATLSTPILPSPSAPTQAAYMSPTQTNSGFISPQQPTIPFPAPVPAAVPFPRIQDALPIQNEAPNPYVKKLEALTKLYTEENKYNRDIGGLTFKLTIFHNLCRKADISPAARAIAFSTMLKGRALNYYYSNSTIASFTFEQMCEKIRKRFDKSFCQYLVDYEGELEKKKDQDKADLDTFEALLINTSDDEDAFKVSVPKQTSNFIILFGSLTLEQAVYAINLLVDRAFQYYLTGHNPLVLSPTIDTYLGPPDLITHDAGKSFISKDFKHLAVIIEISTKAVPVEAYWLIGKVKRYHAVIRRAYQIISEELPNLDKDIALQIAFKAVNDTAGPNELVPTLLVFGAYLRMLQLDAPAPTIAQRSAATKKAMDEDKEDSQLPTAPPPAAPSSTNAPAEGLPTRDPAAESVEPTVSLPRRQGRPRNNAVPALPADISIYLENDLTLPSESPSKSPTELLLTKVPLDDVLLGTWIFNSRFVDEVKHAGTSSAFEKSRLVVQAYNDNELNRNFYVRSPKELELANGTILKVIKPLYNVPEAGNHWFKTYHQHYLEAAFDLLFAAQQIDNAKKGLQYVQLDRSILQLIAFIDAFFANNKDLSSQIGYIIVLANSKSKCNIIHWSSIKCKRITRSVLASELYGMAHGFDIAAALKSTIEKTLGIMLFLVFCTDSKSLYDCLVKLGTTQEKRLIIDLMYLRQSYKRQEIAEIK
ncbi:hypothetical protein B7494_g7997 [Chlorociboria aeruginascens]|nr:hypothetical protein B7494_g7997 [Chlorociboria aeruginascens]